MSSLRKVPLVVLPTGNELFASKPSALAPSVLLAEVGRLGDVTRAKRPLVFSCSVEGREALVEAAEWATPVFVSYLPEHTVSLGGLQGPGAAGRHRPKAVNRDEANRCGSGGAAVRPG